MAYIQGGVLKPTRSIWRLSIFADMFWAIVFYLRMFWKTLFSLDESNAYGKPKREGRPGSGNWNGGGGGPPPGTPGSGPKRFGGMNDVRGQDHNATCGSCCG